MKKLASLMLGLSLAVACVTPAFAEEGKPRKGKKKIKKAKKRKAV